MILTPNIDFRPSIHCQSYNLIFEISHWLFVFIFRVPCSLNHSIIFLRLEDWSRDVDHPIIFLNSLFSALWNALLDEKNFELNNFDEKNLANCSSYNTSFPFLFGNSCKVEKEADALSRFLFLCVSLLTIISTIISHSLFSFA